MDDDPGRRTVLFGGAAVAVGMGGLNPRPLNAPPAGSPGIGVQPGTTGVVIGRVVLVFGPTGSTVGVFVYKVGTTPGPGNAPVSWMSQSTTDTFGNVLPGPGVGVENTVTGLSAVLNAGALNFLGGAGSLTISESLGGQLSINGTPGTNIVNSNIPFAQIFAINPASSAAETWHAPTTTGFGTVAGAQPVEYQIDVIGNVEITGAMAASGAYAAGTTIWTVPVGYRPAAIASVGVTIDTGGAFTAAIAQVDTSGNVSIPINVAGAAEVFFNGGHYRIAA